MQRSDLVSLFLVTSGLNRLYARGLSGPGFPILAYHEVKAKTLVAHLRILSPYYRFMSLEDALAYQAPTNSRPPLVLTFDDGYASWLTDVVPVLKKKRIPALFFPTVQFLGGEQLPWYEVVDRFIRRNRGPSIEVAGERFGVRTLARDPLLRRRLHQRFKSLEHSALQASMAPLEAGLTADDRVLLQNRYLKPEQLRQLSGSLFEVGSHTLTHPILTRIPLSQVREEVTRSRQQLEGWVEKRVRYFAYPNGLGDDFNDLIVGELRRAGYEAALTALSGNNSPGIDPMKLRRAVVAPEGSSWRLRATVTGLLGLCEELWSWRNGGT